MDSTYDFLLPADPDAPEVPWAWSEWTTCRANLYSTQVERQLEGIEMVTRWELRAGDATRLIDLTAALVRVGVLHEELAESLRMRVRYKDSSVPDSLSHVICDARGHVHVLCLAYSMALVRLVNAITDHFPVTLNKEGRSSVRQRAQARGLPPELVTLRHCATHTELPALQELLCCKKVAMDYLWKIYWKPQYDLLQKARRKYESSKSSKKRNSQKDAKEYTGDEDKSGLTHSNATKDREKTISRVREEECSDPPSPPDFE